MSTAVFLRTVPETTLGSIVMAKVCPSALQGSRTVGWQVICRPRSRRSPLSTSIRAPDH